MTSQTEKQIIVVHILTNISRSKGNQATKFGQLIVVQPAAEVFTPFLTKSLPT